MYVAENRACVVQMWVQDGSQDKTMYLGTANNNDQQ